MFRGTSPFFKAECLKGLGHEINISIHGMWFSYFYDILLKRKINTKFLLVCMKTPIDSFSLIDRFLSSVDV